MNQPEMPLEPSYSQLKIEKAGRLQDYKKSLQIVSQLGLLSEKQRSSAQQSQYLNALEDIRENITDFYKLMTEHEFQSIMFWEHDSEMYSWVQNALDDQACKSPKFPDKFTPIDLERLIVKVYQAQTTISGILEEIEPAYKRWLEYEHRCKQIHKAIYGLDKEWQADGLFQVEVPQEVWIRIRRISECIAKLKTRMDSLTNSQNVLSRLITLFQLTPSSPLSRESSLGNGQEFASPRAEPTNPHQRSYQRTPPPPQPDAENKFGQGTGFRNRRNNRA